MASNPKYKYADWQELHGAQKEALEDFASRVSDFAEGTAKEYAAPFANTASMLLDARAKAIKDSPLPPSGFNGADSMEREQQRHGPRNLQVCSRIIKTCKNMPRLLSTTWVRVW